MISGFSNTVPVPDIEELSVSGKLTAESTYIQLYVKYSDLTAEQKIVYSNAVSLVSGKYFTNILNTPAELIIDRMTSEVLGEGTDNFDFNTMSDSDKDKLRSLSLLFYELATV